MGTKGSNKKNDDEQNNKYNDSDNLILRSVGCNKELREKIIKMCHKKNIVVTLFETVVFDYGIKRFGQKRDGYMVVYDYDMTINALADDYFNTNKDKKEYTREDSEMDAMEWIDYNTIRSIPYMSINGYIAPKKWYI